jgi:hypothetical protein
LRDRGDQGRHCEYSSRSDRWTKSAPSGRSAAADTLAPYKTTDDILLLVPALFSDPALVERLAIDPPTFGQEHIRFVANCKMHVDAKMKEVDVRWATNGQWFPQRDVPIGIIRGRWLSDGYESQSRAPSRHVDGALLFLATAARLVPERRPDARAGGFAWAAREPGAPASRLSDGAIESTETDRVAASETRTVVALDA